MMNKTQKIIIGFVAGVLGLSTGIGTSYALWSDETQQNAAKIQLSQTFVNIENSDFTGLSNIDGTQNKTVDNLTYNYDTQNAILKDGSINSLIKDGNFNTVITVQGFSTTHRGIKSTINAENFINTIKNAGGKAYAGWVEKPENCVFDNIDKDESIINEEKSITLLPTYDELSDGSSIREKNAYYCLTASIPKSGNDDGTYTNIGSVTGTTGDDNTELTAEDSWTTNIGTESQDFTQLQEQLNQPTVDVSVTTFRK